MNWSITTKSPGARSSRRLPTADSETMSVTPQRFSASILARKLIARRRQHVAAAVARQEHDRLAVERSEAEFVRGRAERAFDPAPFDIREAVDLIEPAAADDADDGPGHPRA